MMVKWRPSDSEAFISPDKSDILTIVIIIIVIIGGVSSRGILRH